MTSRVPESVRSVVEEGRQAYVTVASRRGPHATPELYAWSGDALWFAAASTTLKAKVLRKRPEVGAVVAVNGRSVLLGGDVALFDARRPGTLLTGATGLPELLLALTRFTVRNAPDLGAFAGDTARGRLGFRLPPPRVVFRLTPRRMALVINDAVTGKWGDWPAPAAVGDTAETTLPAGGAPAIVAVPGPLALPGRWFADEQRVHVSPAVLHLAGLNGEFPLGVVLDDYRAPGPAAKQGTLLRGSGRVVTGAPGFISVDLDHVVEWDGVETTRLQDR